MSGSMKRRKKKAIQHACAHVLHRDWLCGRRLADKTSEVDLVAAFYCQHQAPSKKIANGKKRECGKQNHEQQQQYRREILCRTMPFLHIHRETRLNSIEQKTKNGCE